MKRKTWMMALVTQKIRWNLVLVMRGASHVGLKSLLFMVEATWFSQVADCMVPGSGMQKRRVYARMAMLLDLAEALPLFRRLKTLWGSMEATWGLLVAG